MTDITTQIGADLSGHKLAFKSCEGKTCFLSNGIRMINVPVLLRENSPI